MAKEFKDFDVKFSAYKGKMFEYEDANMIAERAKEIRRWGFTLGVYDNKMIREAVYLASDAEEWQKFRVSLKGMDTANKLARLEYRLMYFEVRLGVQSIERLRIDNYIGALKRGGQLNALMEIVR